MLLETGAHTLLANWPLAIIIVVVVYFFHNRYQKGLSKYPGPWLASFTNLWRFLDVLYRKAHETHYRLYKKHGDLVRLGPNMLMFNDPHAIKEIYGLNKGFVKKTEFYQVQNATAKGRRVQSLFSTTDESYHARFRRCVNNAFAMSTLVSYEPLVDSTTTTFLEQTQKRFVETGDQCNFAEWLQFYAFDVIGEMTWRKRLGFVEHNKDVDGIIRFVGWFLNYSAVVGEMPFLDWTLLDKNPIKMLLGRFNLRDSTSPAIKFAISRAKERESDLEKLKHSSEDLDKPSAKSQKEGVDFLSRFTIAQRDHPEFMTDFQVLTASVSLIFAGSDTTATTLSSIFYCLLRHPRVLEKLMREMDEAEENGLIPSMDENDMTTGLVDWHAAQNLPYLEAVITEAQRLYPAIALNLERYVPPSGATILGEHIPGGTIVGCNGYVLHRNAKIFTPDPETYRPERWLATDKGGDSSPEKIKEMKNFMFQFGAGARTCIGKNISTLEVYKLVPSFLRRFEIGFVDPGKEWDLWNSWFVKVRDFNVYFKPRKGGRKGSLVG